MGTSKPSGRSKVPTREKASIPSRHRLGVFLPDFAESPYREVGDECSFLMSIASPGSASDSAGALQRDHRRKPVELHPAPQKVLIVRSGSFTPLAQSKAATENDCEEYPHDA